jgi:hypothetical protein
VLDAPIRDQPDQRDERVQRHRDPRADERQQRSPRYTIRAEIFPLISLPRALARGDSIPCVRVIAFCSVQLPLAKIVCPVIYQPPVTRNFMIGTMEKDALRYIIRYHSSAGPG